MAFVSYSKRKNYTYSRLDRTTALGRINVWIASAPRRGKLKHQGEGILHWVNLCIGFMPLALRMQDGNDINMVLAAMLVIINTF